MGIAVYGSTELIDSLEGFDDTPMFNPHPCNQSLYFMMESALNLILFHVFCPINHFVSSFMSLKSILFQICSLGPFRQDPRHPTKN